MSRSGVLYVEGQRLILTGVAAALILVWVLWDQVAHGVPLGGKAHRPRRLACGVIGRVKFTAKECAARHLGSTISGADNL
jgi:hypothetical protein